VLEQDFGLDLTDITLTAALEISADGRTIVGRGSQLIHDGPLTAHNVAIGWVAVIPEPATLPLLAVGLAALAVTRRSR
jgi:hypothetical protein